MTRRCILIGIAWISGTYFDVGFRSGFNTLQCTKATCSKGGASRVYRGFSLILGLQIFKSG